ncbi:MAG TPA: hypothetical protein VG826_07040 [Pirellulales bacterium]|nr:hypothetical protein [Pirellulales bacterium]
MTFDPYRKWLSIPEGERPPTHYQLLGVSPDEQDREVINAAVVRQSAFVRSFQTGKYSLEATRLLSEIAAAKVCLLDPAKRAAYDAGLMKRKTAPAASSSKNDSQLSPAAIATPSPEFRPSASQTALRQQPAAAPATPATPHYSPPANSSPSPAQWSSLPEDWATSDLPGDADTPAVGDVLEPIQPGMAFPDALWNEVAELPTPPSQGARSKMPPWFWGVVGGVLGLLVVALLVVLFVTSAPPPDSPGRVPGSSDTGIRSPIPGEKILGSAQVHRSLARDSATFCRIG